jgi:phospholipid-translocating ATPase
VVIYFIIQYAYKTTSARGDGFDVAQYEFSTVRICHLLHHRSFSYGVLQVMVMAAILAANLFNGLNTNVWTGWVFFALALGIVISWAYTVSVIRINVVTMLTSA